MAKIYHYPANAEYVPTLHNPLHKFPRYDSILTKWRRATHKCVGTLCRHCFGPWCGAYLTSSHYLIQSCLIIDWILRNNLIAWKMAAILFRPQYLNCSYLYYRRKFTPEVFLLCFMYRIFFICRSGPMSWAIDKHIIVMLLIYVCLLCLEEILVERINITVIRHTVHTLSHSNKIVTKISSFIGLPIAFSSEIN